MAVTRNKPTAAAPVSAPTPSNSRAKPTQKKAKANKASGLSKTSKRTKSSKVLAARHAAPLPQRIPSDDDDNNEGIDKTPTEKQAPEPLKKAKKPGNHTNVANPTDKPSYVQSDVEVDGLQVDEEISESESRGKEDESEDSGGDGEWKLGDGEEEEDRETDDERGHESDIGEVEDGIDLDEDSIDEDEEDQEQRGRSLKRRAATAREEQARAVKRIRRVDPEFVATPKTITRTPLPQRRRHRPIEVPGHSEPPAFTPPSTPRTVRLTQTAFTPFKPPPKDGKAKQRAASPQTESLLETMDSLFRLYLATHNAFPDSTTTTAEIKAAFLSACSGDPGAPRRALRMEKDPVYADYIRAIGVQRGPQLRGQVRTVAKPLIPGEYQLNGLTKGACAERVQWLKSHARFTFRDVDNRKGMYGHSTITAVIAQQWFGKKTSEGRLYCTHFNPIPLPVIALAATAIQVGLNDWETGVCLPESNKFETTRYRTVYNKHLKNLKKWQRTAPAVCGRRQQELWTSAWAINGGQPISEEDDSEDFSEGEMGSEGEL